MRKPIKKSKRFAVFNRDNHTCQYCGKKAPGVVLEIDHKIPVSKGGDNSMNNLVTSCFDCNRGKSAKILRKPIAVDCLESRMRMMNICAIMHFKEQGYDISPALSQKIISDLIFKCNLTMSEIMMALGSNSNPQSFFKHCLDYYYDLMKENPNVRD